MKSPNLNVWKMVAVVTIGAGAAASAGCATTSSTPALASASGAEDTMHLCSGIPAKERELGLMSYRDAIGETAPWRERVEISKSNVVAQDVGVQIAVRAQPGLTAPWLQRVAMCHAGLASSGQLEAHDAKTDPLIVPGVSISVAESQTGFVVSVRAPNAGSAVDVENRAMAMAKSPAVPATAQGE